MGLRADLDVLAKRKILVCPESNLDGPAHSLVTKLNSGIVFYSRPSGVPDVSLSSYGPYIICEVQKD
jgi:hypothetical protein